MAKLKPSHREILINALVEAEVVEETEVDALEELSDASLVRLADRSLNGEPTSNSEDEDEEDEDELDVEFDDEDEDDEDDEDEPETNSAGHVCNMCAGKGKKKKKEPAMNSAADMTEDEWLENVPPSIARLINNLQESEDDARATIIEGLVANAAPAERNSLIRDLAGYSLDQLRTIQKLTPQRQVAGKGVTANLGVPGLGARRPLYAGAAPAPAPTTNKSERKSEPLIPPTINWAEAAKENG